MFSEVPYVFKNPEKWSFSHAVDTDDGYIWEIVTDGQDSYVIANVEFTPDEGEPYNVTGRTTELNSRETALLLPAPNPTTSPAPPASDILPSTISTMPSHMLLPPNENEDYGTYRGGASYVL